jgi:hypothetical protein
MKEFRVGPVVGICIMIATAVAVVFALPWRKDFYASCDDYGKGMIGGGFVGLFAGLLLARFGR